MSHILLTQLKDGKEYPIVVKVSSLDYSNKSSNSENQFININNGCTSIEVKETAVQIFDKIDEQNVTYIDLNEIAVRVTAAVADVG